MRLFLAIVVILAVVIILNATSRKSEKQNGPANQAVGALAACARYFIFGAMAFLGFGFAMYVGRAFFDL